MPNPGRYVSLRVLNWNTHLGNPHVARSLIVLAAMFRPHVITLQEARGWPGTIPSYKRLADDARPKQHSNNCVTLVQKRLAAKGHPVRVDGDGWNYEGTDKPPRTFYSDAVRKGGLTWWVLDVHRCTGGTGRNKGEWSREGDAIQTWSDLVPRDDPSIVVGDHNDPGTVRRPGTVADLADLIDAVILKPDGHHIDYALVRNCGGAIRSLKSKFGSDHFPQFITVKAHRPRR